MKQRILSFFTTDIKWKLICLGLAILLWLISSNFNNPTETRSFNVPLEIHNAEILTNAGIVILNQENLDAQIRVGIRAQRWDFEALDEARDIRASIDLRAIPVDTVLSAEEPVTVLLSVGVNLSEELELSSISPSTIELVVDVMARESFPIRINIEGETAPGLELMPIRLINNVVTITGPRSLLSDIEEVRVNIDVLGIHAETEISNLPLYVITRSGQDILPNLLHLNVWDTGATIPVWPIETVELRVQTTGNLAPGYAVDTVVLEPGEIDIVAPPHVLADIHYILLEIDLNAANATFSEELLITLPDGVYLRTGEVETVNATVIVEPIERRIFNVPRDNVRIRGLQAIYQILSNNANIRVEVAGSRGQITDLTLNDIGLELDLRNLPIGIHYVVLNVSLPTGVTVFQNAPALQVQIHEPAPAEPDIPPQPPFTTEEPEPTPEPDPEPDDPIPDDDPNEDEPDDQEEDLEDD